MYDLSDFLYPSFYPSGLFYRKREMMPGQRIEWRTMGQSSSSESVGVEKLFRLKVMNRNGV